MITGVLFGLSIFVLMTSAQRPTTTTPKNPVQSDDFEALFSAKSSDETKVYTTKLPPPPISTIHRLDFSDWDSVDEESNYDAYNQTIINGMRAGTFQSVSTASTATSTLAPHRSTPPVIMSVDPEIFEEDKDYEDLPTTTSSTIAKSTRYTPPVTISFENGDFETDEDPPSTTSSTTAKPKQNTPSPTYLQFEGDMYEYGESETETASVSTGTTSDEDGSTDIIPMEPEDYILEDAEKDPCNYARRGHQVPKIEKTRRSVSDYKCEEYMWIYKINVTDTEKNNKLCLEQMKKKKEQVSQVYHGIKALDGDFPHMGAVGWISKNGERKFMCGSSLISPRFSLTAAHCQTAPTSSLTTFNLIDIHPKVVRFGSVYLKEKADKMKNSTAKEVYIEEFLVTKEYEKFPKRKYNDIALLKLMTEVQFESYIKPACLYNGYVGESWSANVTGWGRTTDNVGSESNQLLYAELDFVQQNICKVYVKGHINRKWPVGLKDHQFCAGKLEGGVDACQGDSGGPLGVQEPMPAKFNTSDLYHRIIGVTSFGVKCGLPQLPGVYTNVTSFLCWIEKTVWPEEPNNCTLH